MASNASCDVQWTLNNWTRIISQLNRSMPDYGVHDHMDYYINNVVVPAVCAFGVLGNLLNLIVLTQRQLHCSMDYMEKSAHMGIVALAVSDIIFCILALPMAFIPMPSMYVESHQAFNLFYKLYHQPLLNIFLLSSTWLVVIMASARYLAICRPLHARSYINLRRTFVAILLVFVISLVVNLPQFWRQHTTSFPCHYNKACVCHRVLNSQSAFYVNTSLRKAYTVFRAIIGTFIPLIMLSFCNICLILALRQSYRMQRRYRANAPKESRHRITLTLVTMVVLFILLVCPSTFLSFFKELGMGPRSQDLHRYLAYRTATNLTNLTQAINFSVNFVLYCVINVHFRKVMAQVICCRFGRRKKTNDLRLVTQATYNTDCMSDTDLD